MTRRYDPGRRRRIVDAAARVIAARGIAGLSHRSVAAEADVPLGSTTYHFRTLDDLLEAALRQAGDDFAESLRERGAFGDTGVDLATELAEVTGEWLGRERSRVELEYELYLAALRRPALRAVAARWARELREPLAWRTDPATAQALVALTDGLCLQALLATAPYDRAHAREMYARLIP